MKPDTSQAWPAANCNTSSNLRKFSDVAITKALASLTEQGVLEAKGEKRGRKYRISTAYLKKIFSGALKP